MTQRTEARSGPRPRWILFVLVACLLVPLIALLLPRPKPVASNQAATTNQLADNSMPRHPQIATLTPLRNRSASTSAASAEPAAQMVARKAKQFGHLQHDFFYKMVKKRNMKVPKEVERFFEAAEKGDWEQLEASFKKLSAVAPQRSKNPGEADRLWGQEPRPDPDELGQLWSSINATFGPLEQAHQWPPQEYLDYGNAILDSLRPGMVYVGGTDPGRFIPELLAATSDGEQHVVITQNALADGSYLDYIRAQFGDRMGLPSSEDAQRAFDQYTTDARARLLHDQQFPNEPPQLKPGENVTIDDQGKVNVSGQVSVMLINELILQDILQKNPSLSFGLEESFPLKSTYGDAAPLGPIMELRAQGGQDALTADSAGQSLDYWKDRVQQLLSDPAASGSDWMKAYAKMIDGQANLFNAHGLNDQAEQAYRLSLQVTPGNPEAVLGYTNLLVAENRSQDALAIAQSAAQAHPDNQQFQDLVSRLQAPAKAQ